MKNKQLKKLLAILLSCVSVTATLSGCGNAESANVPSDSKAQEASSVAESSAATESTAPVAEEPAFDPKSITEGVTLTVTAPENLRIEDYNTNDMTLMVEEALGVNLEFVTYPSADYDTKINIMALGGDELPDIILKPSDSLYLSWAEEGAIIPLTEYYENPDLCQNIQNASERTNIDIPMYLTQSDGEIYCLPRLGQSTGSEVWEKLWVYEPWLEAIGKDVPETTEEFYEVCKLIAETDLNGNGKADEIALTGDIFGNWDDAWFKCLMSAFVYAHDGEYRIVEDGKLNFAYTTEEWKEGLKYIKKFFDEGLIPVETLTQDRTQYSAMVKADEQIVFSLAYWNYFGTNQEISAGYTYIPALKGPEGVQYAQFTPALPTAGAIISADCENPEAAFLVCDYMCSEEMSISQRWGKRGEDWDYWEDAKVEDKSQYSAAYPGYDISIIAYDDATFWLGTDIQNRSYLQTGCFVWDQNTVNGLATLNVVSTKEEELAQKINATINEAVVECHKYSPDEVVDYMPLTADETASVTDIKATLATYITEMTCAFLTGSKDIDAEWDSYLENLQKIGYQDILEVYQIAYDRAH